MKKKINSLLLISILIAVAGISAAGFLGYRYYLLAGEFSKNTGELGGTVAVLLENLATTAAQRDDFEQKYLDEKARMDYFSSQIEGIQGSVSLLERLSRTDPELLKKYSKVYFLNENYTPKSFAKIDSKYTFDTQKDYLFYLEVWPFLQNMLSDAENAGIDLSIISAYRSFGAQADAKSTFKTIYGSGANTFSADQGYSEHQLGTAIDFTTKTVGATYEGFEETQTYSWLMENAYKYGFIISYPKENQYYIFEPWHWRFVGKKLAEKLHIEGRYFYDLDQREIDQYLIFFFD